MTFACVRAEETGRYPGKQIVTLATTRSEDYYLDILVRMYNRQSREYQVEVIQEGSASSMEEKLIRGKGADLIDLSMLYADNLAEMGAFEDLTAYYEASETVDWEDLLEPVRNGCVIRGQNVAVIPMFCINTMLEKESWYTAENWTVWEFLKMGQGRKILPVQNPMRALEICMGLKFGEHFIDYEKKECHFDNGEFARILEACSRWDIYDTQIIYPDFISGDHVLQESKRIASVWDMVSEMNPAPDYAERIVGYPGWSGGEHELYVDASFAMNSDGENKAGAWDFLEYLLSGQLQDMVKYWYHAFPVRKDQFEADLEERYTDAALRDLHGGIPVDPAEPTENDIRLLREIVDSAVYKNWIQGNNPVWNIVHEEAEMYFAGDCPVEETVQKIQNRVQMYLDEM